MTPSSPVPPSLEVAAVTKRFGDVAAVRSVTLVVRPGEVVGLLGANGAGKTTLVRMVLGLVAPSEGTIRLFGSPPTRAARRRAGYVPQGLGLYEDLTVAENLAFTAAAFGAGTAALDDDLAAVAGTPVGALPLGLQRRVAFAAALAHRPELLVLDEPTSGVEPLARAGLWDRIRDAAAGGAGVLITTHHMDEAEQCDRLVVMADGAVRAEGSVAGIVGDARVAEVATSRWDAAFEVLDDLGVAPSLAGRVLHVPVGDADRAMAALATAGITATSTTVPATLEEAFTRLVRAAAG